MAMKQVSFDDLRNWLLSEHKGGWEYANFDALSMEIPTEYGIANDVNFENFRRTKPYITSIICEIMDKEISYVDFNCCSFRYIQFVNVDFTASTFRHCTFISCSFKNCKVDTTRFTFCEFAGCVIEQTNFRDVSAFNCCNVTGMYGYDSLADLPVNLNCPDTGSFIAWKVAKNVVDHRIARDILIKLLIPTEAKRSSAFGRKCRASEAYVLDMEYLNIKPSELKPTRAYSSYDSTFVYHVGDHLVIENFDECRWKECAPGIHFFITKQDAIDYSKGYI